METIIYWVQTLLGLNVEPKDLSFLQMGLRGVIIFIAAIIMVRVGDKRFLSKKTAFDAVLGFILASTLARAINGSAAFFETLGTGFAIVLLHRVLAHLSTHCHALGHLVKGQADVVIENGQVNWKVLRKNAFSERDLREDLRMNGVECPEQVKSAQIERNGEISVLKH